MAIAIVQRQSAAVATNVSVSVTLGSTPVAGNLLIGVVKDNLNTNTWTLPSGWAWMANSPWASTTTRQLGVAYKVVVSDGTGVTFTSSGANDKALTVWEASGVTTTGAYDVTTANQNSVTSKQLTTTGVLPTANCLVIAACDQAINNGGEVSVDSSFTLRDTGTFDRIMMADKITSATTALAPTFTWTTARATMGIQAVFPEYIAPVGYMAQVYNGTTWVDHQIHTI